MEVGLAHRDTEGGCLPLDTPASATIVQASRGRDDFQQLLAELEKGAGKPKPKSDRPQK
jgi:hypothetical protein